MAGKTVVRIALLSILVVSVTAFAETVTVSKSGTAKFTSIQAAIDAVNPKDGNPDVIQILDGSMYEEQVVVGGLPEVNEAGGDFIGALVAENRDPITIIGPASGNAPAISPKGESLLYYSVNESDPGDNFQASLSFFGKNITFENLILEQPGGGPYGVNGQGVEITFRKVLFRAKAGSGTPGEAVINFNNSDRVADYFNQVPCSAVFENCTWDGLLDDGTQTTKDAVYYHGTTGPGLDGIEQPNTSTFVFKNCTFQHHEEGITRLRSRGANKDDVVNQIMQNCLIKDNNGNSINVDGAGEKLIQDCIFFNNVNGLNEALPTGTNAALFVRGRDGHTGNVTVSHCIFSNNASLDASDDPALDLWAALLITNDGADNGPVVVDHCTFDRNGTAVRIFDTSQRARTVTISNTIFSNNKIAVTGNAASAGPSYVGSGNEANLALTLTNCLLFGNVVNTDIGVSSGAIFADPLFANTDALGENPFALKENSPARKAATDGTDIGATQSATAVSNFMLY
ncbi:MAG TPA: right-handed parallel beta-helix repeat-containing protein [bacterium]|nr:right-handed parallel beta-helix repeat-containing protein [bacterium]HQL60978.1 right-handed parallel beta-helix repeat-containing protein [bacterium]